MRRLSIPQEEKIIWPALLIARAITSGTSAGYVVFHRRDIGVSQVVLHSLHSLEQPWKTCCMKDAMNHQENGLVWNCSSFLATYCPLLFHVWHRLLGWAPGAHPVPFPHISLPPSNTAHPEQRKNINFIWRKKKKKEQPCLRTAYLWPCSLQCDCQWAAGSMPSNPALQTNDFRGNTALHSEWQPPPVTRTSSLPFVV